MARSDPTPAAEYGEHQDNNRNRAAEQPPELSRSPAGEMWEIDVHSVQSRQQRKRHEDGGHHRQHFHDLVQAIADIRQMGVQNTGDPVLKQQRIVGNPDQVIVHVPEAEGHFRADIDELAPRQSGYDVTLWSRDPPQRSHIALFVENVTNQRACRIGEDLFFQVVESIFELLDLRAIVVHHRVDDAMEQRNRTIGENSRVAGTILQQVRYPARSPDVNGHEIVRAQEEIDVVSLESTTARSVVDGMKDNVEVAVVS